MLASDVGQAEHGQMDRWTISRSYSRQAVNNLCETFSCYPSCPRPLKWWFKGVLYSILGPHLLGPTVAVSEH